MSQSYQPGDYNRGGMIAFVFTMVFTLVFFVYIAFVHSGVDLKEIPADKPAKKEVPADQPEANKSPE